MMAHGHAHVSSAEPRNHDRSGNIFVRPVVKPSQMKAHTISKRLTGKSLKRKGDTFERDLARWFNIKLRGNGARHSRSSIRWRHTSLNSGGADLIGLPLVFVEAKRETEHPRGAPSSLQRLQATVTRRTRGHNTKKQENLRQHSRDAPTGFHRYAARRLHRKWLCCTTACRRNH